VPELSAFEVEMAIEKIKRQILPGIDVISEEIIKAWISSTCSEIHKIINSVWNEEELPVERKESIIVPTYL
jgi:hypothetical protein